MELKTHGREQGDYLGDVIAVLAEHGLARESLVQAFDATLFAEVNTRFPEVQAGWVVAFLRGRLDPAGADFVTMEQSSYSTRALEEAHGADTRLFLWTVTNTTSMRQHMRDGVDGLITGSVVAAVEERERVAAETGFAGRLEDELRSVVAWW